MYIMEYWQLMNYKERKKIMGNNLVFSIKNKWNSFIEKFKYDKKFRIRLLFLVVLFLLLIISTQSVIAEELASESEVGKILLKHEKFFGKKSLFRDFVR